MKKPVTTKKLKKPKSKRSNLINDLDRKLLDMASQKYDFFKKTIKRKSKQSKTDLVLELGAKVLDRVRAFRKKPTPEHSKSSRS